MQKSNTLSVDSLPMNKLVRVKQALRGRILCACIQKSSVRQWNTDLKI